MGNDDEPYHARVARSLELLGIPAGYGAQRSLMLHPEAAELVSVGLDIHGRERHLAPGPAARWAALQAAAQGDGMIVQLVSAFRSLEYQQQIFERKMTAGQALDEILLVNVPPGYSEHHTGRAVDVTTPGCEPLTEGFESTEAFRWLTQHAGRFDFVMTYPRGNPFGIAYEPWHWAAR